MEAGTDISRMTRDIHPVPDDVSTALKHRKLLSAYGERPGYQQNDYIGWIERGKRSATRQKRLEQMLDELEAGDVYMKMAWTQGGNAAR